MDAKGKHFCVFVLRLLLLLFAPLVPLSRFTILVHQYTLNTLFFSWNETAGCVLGVVCSHKISPVFADHKNSTASSSNKTYTHTGTGTAVIKHSYYTNRFGMKESDAPKTKSKDKEKKRFRILSAFCLSSSK